MTGFLCGSARYAYLRWRLAACPTESARQVTDQFAPAIGAGPVYAVLDSGEGVLHYAPPANFGSAKWAGQKVLWIVEPKVRGPILVRGHQLDGPTELRLGAEGLPATELRLSVEASSSDEWANYPTYTRVQATVCYAYQVDGFDFTEVIVFQAQPA